MAKKPIFRSRNKRYKIAHKHPLGVYMRWIVAGINELPANLKDDTTRMNDRDKHKVTGQMNHQKADPKANASVFLFFPAAHFLKTNKPIDSRIPIKDKLNKRVILASHTNDTFSFARHKPTLRKTKRAIFFQLNN